jgi:hypothetical protein
MPEYLSRRPLLDNGLLKHVSETAHTETSIARQRLKRCPRYNQYLEIKPTCYLKMKTRSHDNADNRYGSETLQEGVF